MFKNQIKKSGMYYGQKILYWNRRRVSGGYVVDCERHPDAKNWPSTISRWVSNEDCIEPCND